MEFLRRRIGLILRVIFSALLIYFLVRNKETLYECYGHMREARVGWLLVGLALLGVTMVVSTYRWKILLAVQDIHMEYRALFPLNMIGQFFSAFLLGVTGGDVMKIYYISQANPEKRSAASLSVVFDRIQGLLGIMLWGLMLTGIYYRVLTSTSGTRRNVWLFLLICAAAVGGIIAALILPWIRKNSSLWKLEQKLPFHSTLENLSEAFQRYTRRPFENAVVLAMSVFIHACLFCFMYAVARSINMDLSFWKIAAVVSIVNVLIAVPISIAGIGVREKLYIWFLALFAVPEGQALAFSLLGFALSLIWNLAGGYFYARYKKRVPVMTAVPLA